MKIFTMTMKYAVQANYKRQNVKNMCLMKNLPWPQNTARLLDVQDQTLHFAFSVPR